MGSSTSPYAAFLQFHHKVAETRRDASRQTAHSGQAHLQFIDEQVATIRANRIIAEARREALRAQSYQCEQSEQKEAEETSEMALEEQHELRDDDAWEELNKLITSASPANLPSESEPDHAHAAQSSTVQLHLPLAGPASMRRHPFLVVSSFHLVHCR